jgi:LAO/AO transport system kinase
VTAASSDVASRVLAGELRAAARLMRDLDDAIPAARETLRELFPRTGKAWVIGLTGAPGAGKSSLTDRLIAHFRGEGRSVGVVAVDPTSPFSGGAILGDRIRMQDHAVDPGVFIRSLATRGNLGGLSRSTADVVTVMDAMGKDVIIVETVGVGQDEIEIAALAHTVVVVSVPGLGDDVQAIKAGVLEIADVFAVNKADREGADRTVRDLQMMLEIRHTVSAPALDHDAHHRMTLAGGGEASLVRDAGDWEPPIVKTVATRGEGTAELAAALVRHRADLESSGGWKAREVSRARAGFLTLLRERLLTTALERLQKEHGSLDSLAERIAAREADPYALADAVAARMRG